MNPIRYILAIWLTSLFLTSAFHPALSQNTIGYRWAKPVEVGYYSLDDLASRNQILYSIGSGRITRYDSAGNVSRTFSTISLPEYDNPISFSVTSRENFLVRTDEPGGFCGTGFNDGNEWEKFLDPVDAPFYMHSYWWSSGAEPGASSGGSNGESFQSTRISPSDHLFTHVRSGEQPDYNIPLYSLHIFQVADTNLSLKWRKKIRTRAGSQAFYTPTHNDRYLVTLVTSDTVEIDSSQILPVSNPSVVHLFFDVSGNLVESKVFPNTLVTGANYYNVRYYLQPDNSLFQLYNRPDSTLPNNNWRHTLRYVDASGHLRWEKKFNWHGRLSYLHTICPDDSSNVLCSFLDYDGVNYYNPGFMVLSNQGQVLWADSSNQHCNYSDSRSNLQNMSILNWAAVMEASDSIKIGPFHQPLPQYHKAFLVNIRGNTPLTLSTAAKYCSSESPEIHILSPPIQSTTGLDTFLVYLSDSAGSFASSTLVGKSTSVSLHVVFPPALPAGTGYRFRAYSTIGLYGPPSPPIIIGPTPVRPVITSATGSFSTCLHTPLRLSTPQTTADLLWSSGETNTSSIAIPNVGNYVTAKLGSCLTRSDTVFVQGIRDEVHFLFTQNHCNATDPIPLGTQPATGYWTGPQLDSTGFRFLPQLISDTVTLHYHDTTIAQCPIDTAVQIFQLVRPTLPQLLDTVVCQQTRSIALPRLPFSDVRWSSTDMYIGDSLWLGDAGNKTLTYAAGPYWCSASKYMRMEVIWADYSPCFGLDTMAGFTYYMKEKHCAPTQYYTHIGVDPFAISPQTRFQVQLSDSSGNFDHPIVLAESHSPLLKLVFPDSLTDGIHYQTRLKMLSPNSLLPPLSGYLRINPTPESPVIKSLGSTVRCINDPLPPTRFYVDEGYPHVWYPNVEVADTITPTPGTYYSVKANNHGCNSYPSQSMRFTLQSPRIVNLTSPSKICTPASAFSLLVNATATGGLWTGQQVDSVTGKFHPANVDDTLLVRYRNYFSGNVCLTDTTFSIYQMQKPQIPVSSSVYVCQNAGLYTLPYAQQNMVWSGGGGSGVVNQNQYNPATTVGQHIVYGVATHGFCIVNTKIYFTVRDSLSAACLATETHPIQEENVISLFPNPAEDYIQLITNHQILATTITDALGRKVVVCQAEPAEARLNIGHLLPGLYWVKVRTEEGVSVQRLVKR